MDTTPADTASDGDDVAPSARWRTIRVVLDIGMGPRNFRNGRELAPGTTLAEGVANYVRQLVEDSEAAAAGELEQAWAVNGSDAPRDSALREERAIDRAQTGSIPWPDWAGWALTDDELFQSGR